MSEIAAVLFWDIDGTLLTTGRAGIHAWEDAVAEVCGRSSDLSDFTTAGLTDGQIAARLLDAHGDEPDDDRIDALLRAYERRLPSSLHRRTGGVLPGVRPILADLGGREDVLSLLLTGNTPAGAAAKLRHYGLDDVAPSEGAFCVGGGERDEIARVARTLAETTAGAALADDRLYVIGDTPHDVRCGQSIGARTIAVATGGYALDELADTGAWKVLEQLPPPDEFRVLVGIDAR